MMRVKTWWIGLFMLFWGAVQAADLAAPLKSLDHVLLMRHAYAPGVGDPAGYVLERCETQRILNQEGKTQATRNTRLQSFIAQALATKGDQALILVTHHVNILEFMGHNIGSGDMVLARVNPQGQLVDYTLFRSP